MGFLSIKKQIVQIIQTLAYKAYGFDVHYPWQRAQLIINKQQDKIGYKIPIPNIIYNKYSQDGFIYSDPGTTPRQIAQDILTHFKSLNHLQMESDQFGNIVGYVKQQYFQQISDEFIKSNRITCRVLDELSYHQNQSIKHIREQQHHQVSNNTKQLLLVLFRENKQMISLSQLRQQYVFEAIANIQRSIFNRSKAQIVNVFASCGDGNNDKLEQFNTNTHEVIYSSLQHEVIGKQKRIQQLLNIDMKEMEKEDSDNVKVMKFGIVVPQGVGVSCCGSNKDNSSNNGINQQLTTTQISKLKSIFYDHPLYKPIHLPLLTHTNQQFHTLLTKHLITPPPTIQQLILKIDQLTSQHKINQLYHLYLVLNYMLQKQCQEIQQENNGNKSKLKYINVANVIVRHLHDEIFFYS